MPTSQNRVKGAETYQSIEEGRAELFRDSLANSNIYGSSLEHAAQALPVVRPVGP